MTRGTLLGLLPTTAAHVYAGTLAPSSAELMSLGHENWSCQHGKSTCQQKSCVLRTGSGAAMKAMCADSKYLKWCSRWHQSIHPPKTTLTMGKQPFEDVSPTKNGEIFQLAMLCSGEFFFHFHWGYIFCCRLGGGSGSCKYCWGSCLHRTPRSVTSPALRVLSWRCLSVVTSLMASSKQSGEKNSTSLRLVVVDSSHDVPASSKWPFDHPNGGPLTPEKVT